MNYKFAFLYLELQIYKTRTNLPFKVINRLINIGLLRLWDAVLPLPALNEQGDLLHLQSV